MKTSLKNRPRILSNYFAINPGRPVTQKKVNLIGAEGTGPRPISDRDSKIFGLAVPVLKLT